VAKAGVALAGRETVTDNVPAINSAAAVPQTRAKAVFACTFILILSEADCRLGGNIARRTTLACMRLVFYQRLERMRSQFQSTYQKNYVANVIQIKLHFGHRPKLIVRNRANLTQVNVPYALAPKHKTVKDLLSKGG
jgi:hypothetical protein